jgi:hypothetical protein
VAAAVGGVDVVGCGDGLGCGGGRVVVGVGGLLADLLVASPDRALTQPASSSGSATQAMIIVTPRRMRPP